MPEDPHQFTLRPARGDDVDAMIVVTAEVFAPASIDARFEQALGRGGAASWVDMKAAGIRREMADRPDACFVAEAGGRVVGFVTCSIDESASRGRIVDLAVAKGFQGRGIGRGLLRRSLERFGELGLRHAKIETLATNQAGQHLYTSVGFREIVRQVHFGMSLD